VSRAKPIVRLVAALAAIAAIALAAATVRSPLETGGSGGAGGGDGTGSGTGQPPSAEPVESGEVPAFLEYLVYVVVALLAIAVVWYLLAHRRDAVKMIAIGLLIVAALLGLAYALMAAGAVFDAEPPPEEGENESEGFLEEGGEPGDGDESDSSLPIGPLLAVLALITAIFVGGLVLSRGDNDGIARGELADANPEPRRSDAAAVGSAAGRAADRIDEGTAVDNEIYRAWREMTGLLEVDRPESSTPREFAETAVEAGLEREDVDELTRLFEDVRYGDVETTAEMEERAVSVLRRIETEYAAEDADAANATLDRRPSADGDSA
jgi:multisubunit Na+/H+ antiporter MnhC subunit